MLAEQDDIIVPTHYNARLEYAIAKTLTDRGILDKAPPASVAYDAQTGKVSLK